MPPRLRPRLPLRRQGCRRAGQEGGRRSGRCRQG
jgi:hypothetical protein